MFSLILRTTSGHTPCNLLHHYGQKLSFSLRSDHPFHARDTNGNTQHDARSASSIAPTKPLEYNWIDAVEHLDMYEPGGYHPVIINDLLHNRYRILDKLGYGGYSTIWLARDEHLERYTAIKIQISGHPNPTCESNILKALAVITPLDDSRDTIPKILDDFEIEGPNGIHTCYAMEPTQRDLRNASFSCLFPLRVARALCAELALTISLIHSQGIVHGDIRLSNILTTLPSSFQSLSIPQLLTEYGSPEKTPITLTNSHLLPLPPNIPAYAALPLHLGPTAPEFTINDARALILADFGEAFSPAIEARLGRDCHSPIASRAPEAFFEPDTPLGKGFDVWSFGVAMWDILGMQSLFSECDGRDEVVAQQLDVLGFDGFPEEWKELWERAIVRREDGEEEEEVPCRPVGKRESWAGLEERFEEAVHKYRRTQDEFESFGNEETRAILELMRGMLRFRPENRLSIDEVLCSRWMVEWALPELTGNCCKVVLWKPLYRSIQCYAREEEETRTS